VRAQQTSPFCASTNILAYACRLSVRADNCASVCGCVSAFACLVGVSKLAKYGAIVCVGRGGRKEYSI